MSNEETTEKETKSRRTIADAIEAIRTEINEIEAARGTAARQVHAFNQAIEALENVLERLGEKP